MKHKISILDAFALSIGTLGIVAGLVILIPATGAAQTPLFLPAVTYPAGDYSLSVTTADVNSDGKADLVVANFGTLGVLLGNGDGTFQPVATYNTGSAGPGTSVVAVGDLNNDGRPDVVVIGVGSETLSLLLGNGDGTFQPAAVYLLPAGGGGWPGAVAVGDMNKDGNTDLLLGDGAYVSSIGVALGNGSGTFSTYGGWSWYYPNGLGSSSIVAADVNNDRKTDVVVTTWYVSYLDTHNGTVSIFLGNGDGTLQPAITYNLSGNAYSVAVGDLNGDGKLDLAVATSCSGCEGLVDVLLGKGDGTFQPAVSYDSGGLGTQSVAIADVNGDGKLDLVVANRDSSSVGVLLGNGNGTFQPPAIFASGGYLAESVTTGDVNSDGKPDVIVANLCADNSCAESGTVGVLLNNTPFCTSSPVIRLSASPNLLWPPNGKMVPVRVSGTITDAGTGCTVRSAAYTVRDEYGELQPSGPVTLGPGGAFSFTVLLQASRLGTDLDGRSYKVTVRASNNVGKTGSKVANVVAPHDHGH